MTRIDRVEYEAQSSILQRSDAASEHFWRLAARRQRCPKGQFISRRVGAKIDGIGARRLTMIRMIFATIAALAGVFFGLQPAQAYEAPWCAVIEIGRDSIYWDCQYRSFEECRPNVLAGNRGFCNPSPYYVANPTEHKRPAKRRARPL
jgi:hypothetical protein